MIRSALTLPMPGNFFQVFGRGSVDIQLGPRRRGGNGRNGRNWNVSGWSRGWSRSWRCGLIILNFTCNRFRARIGARKSGAGAEVGFVCLEEFGRFFDDEQVLGVALLGSFGEIEAARDEGCRWSAQVDEHDFGVCDGGLEVDQHFGARVLQEGRAGISSRFVGLVEDGLRP
jgi:hypothetical protein